MNHNPKDILKLLRSGDRSFYEEQYVLYKEEFTGYMIKKGLQMDAVEQVYQDSFIQLFENVVTGKLVTLTSGLKTYLFGIGHYKMMEYFKSQGKYVNLDPDYIIKEENPLMFFNETSLTDQQQLLYKALGQIGKRCRQILELFYLNGLTIQEIVDVENYTNQNTVKAQKSRCLKQLKELAHQSNG